MSRASDCYLQCRSALINYPFPFDKIGRSCRFLRQLAPLKQLIAGKQFAIVTDKVKNPCPKDVALIHPQRGLMKIVNHPRVILEEWNDGVME